MNTVSVVNFISFHYWLSCCWASLTLNGVSCFSSPHLCNLSSKYYTKKSQYLWNKHITAWKMIRTIFILSLIHIRKLNSWIKIVHSHFPWSNLYMFALIIRFPPAGTFLNWKGEICFNRSPCWVTLTVWHRVESLLTWTKISGFNTLNSTQGCGQKKKWLRHCRLWNNWRISCKKGEYHLFGQIFIFAWSS